MKKEKGKRKEVLVPGLKSIRRSSFFIFLFSFFIMIALGSCSTYWPTESKTFSPEFGIEALLVDGQPIDSVWVSLSYDILESQSAGDSLYDSAFIVVYTASDSDTLVPKDTLPNCFYSPDTANKIQSGETYYIYARVFKAGADTVTMTAQTTVPDTFTCIPLAPVWLTDTTLVDEYLQSDYKDISLIDMKTGKPVYEPFNAGDTGYYLYHDTLRFYTFLIGVFYDQVFDLNGQQISLFSVLSAPPYNIPPPNPPNQTAKGVMVEYEWGIGRDDWGSLEFVMGTNFLGMQDSSGYYVGTHLNGGTLPNTETDLAFFFGNYAVVKYEGHSAFNFFAVDEAAFDYEQTKYSGEAISNVSGGRGVFGSASVFRLPFYVHAERDLITNRESKAIKERYEAEMD